MSLHTQSITAVLFDLDGTLLDSAPDLAYAANQLRIVRGLEPLPQSRYRPFVGTGARGMLRIALDIEPSDPAFDALKEEFFHAYECCMGQHSKLFDGVEKLVQRLQAAHIQWGIVTNKSERFTLPIVAALDHLKGAGAVVCGDTTPYAKPHPQPLLEAARRLGVQAQHCVYVGDDERDMIASHAAGMQSVAAAYGYLGHFSSVESWKPHAIINSPCELAQRLGLD